MFSVSSSNRAVHMDSSSLAHFRRHFGAHLHLQLLFLEPSQWSPASGVMCNIFVDTCIRPSGVSADFLHLLLPQASLPRGFHCTAQKASLRAPGLSLCCAGIILPPTLSPSQLLLAAAQKHLALWRSRCGAGVVGSGSVGSVDYKLRGLSMSSAFRNKECLVSLRP